MNCMFPSLGLDTCEPGVNCFSQDEKNKMRSNNLWRLDGMQSRRKQHSVGVRVLREADSYRKEPREIKKFHSSKQNRNRAQRSSKKNRNTTQYDINFFDEKSQNNKINRNNTTPISSKKNRNTTQYDINFFDHQKSQSIKVNRNTSAPIPSKQNRKTTKSHSKQNYQIVNSYFEPRYVPNTVSENGTHSTCPSTDPSDTDAYTESSSIVTGESEWTSLTAGTLDSKVTAESWMQAYFDKIERQEEPEIQNVWSGDDDFSVGAVKTTKHKREEEIATLSAQAGSAYYSAFSYIRKAGEHISKPMKDPPSDQSMVTTQSIRAEDAGSAVLRHGILRRQEERIMELARVIQKRKELELQRAGIES